MAPQTKLAIVYYSTYGHVARLAEEVKKGMESKDAKVDIFQFPETESELKVLNAVPKADHPELSDPSKLKEYDGFAFGFATRYGRAPYQVNAFFDKTGGLWASGALLNKFATIFTSTGSQHGGQETTALTTLPFAAHHGIIYVSPAYAKSELSELNEIVGGSAYGAAAIAGGDASRQVTEKELAIAEYQGQHFANIVSTYVKGSSDEKEDQDTSGMEAAGAGTTAGAAGATKAEASEVTGATNEGKAENGAGTKNTATNAQSQAKKSSGGLFSCCSSKSQSQNFDS